MGLAVALLGWLVALISGWLVAHRLLPRRPAVVATMMAALGTSGLAWFWPEAVTAWWLGEDAILAGPETAWLSMWAFVVLPIARQCLDRGWLWEAWRDGLVAVAALGLSVDVAHVMIATLGIAHPSGVGATLVGMAVMSVFFTAGIALCLVASTRWFPWEYVAWFSGVAVMAGTVPAALPHLALVAHGGLATVVGAFLTGYLLSLAASHRGVVACLWGGLGVLLPVGVTALCTVLEVAQP